MVLPDKYIGVLEGGPAVQRGLQESRRSPFVVKLSAEERAVLSARAAPRTARHAEVVRARIVRGCRESGAACGVAPFDGHLTIAPSGAAAVHDVRFLEDECEHMGAGTFVLGASVAIKACSIASHGKGWE